MPDPIVAAILGALVVGIIFLLLRSRKGSELVLIQTQISELRTTVDQKLGDSTKMFQQQYGESAKLIESITEKLTRLDETNKQVVSFADQLQNLEDILKNPKHRGILGEYYLETVLKNVLPPQHYQIQYPFANGEIVDAVIFVQDKIIPIDSKLG